ncbi:MAG: hypothetical protein ABSH01_05650 [Terriglobia bacterium]
MDRSEPPHIQVRRENRVAKFWLEPVALERPRGFTGCGRTRRSCHSERSGAERRISLWTFPSRNSRARCFPLQGGISMTAVAFSMTCR